MRRWMRTGVVGCSLLAASLPGPATAQPSLNGFWAGTITRDGITQEIDIRVDGSTDAYKANFDWPDSGYFHDDATAIKVKDHNVRVSLPMTRGALRLIGTWDGDVFAGDLEEIGNVAGAWKTTHSDGSFRLVRAEDKPLPYRTEEISFHDGAVTLRGTLLIPNGGGRHPAIAFLPGSGDQLRSEGMFVGDTLVRQGVVVLVYDKRGAGQSTGDWRNGGFEELGDDGAAALAVLRARPDVDAQRTGFVCESQGCWVAPFAISRGAPAKFLVGISGPTVTVEEQGYDQYLNRLREAGMPDTELAKAMPLLKLDNDVCKGKASWEDLQAEIAKDEDQPWFKAINWTAEDRDDPERKFYGKILGYDPKADLEKMKIPSLWLFGTDDITIPAQASWERLEGMSMSPKPQIAIMKNADHSLIVRDGGRLPVLADGFPAIIADWIGKQ
ncbi:MAG: alpha/beta hydrolase [Rhizomicrobium sp.]